MLGDTTTGESGHGCRWRIESEHDTCGDLNSGSYNLTFFIPNVLCQAAPGTDPPILKLPNCTSWHSNQGTACALDANVGDANPDTKSKCVCDDAFTVPVLVETGTLTANKQVTDNAAHTVPYSSLPEPGGQFTYTITATNPSTIQDITLDRICDDQYGLIVKIAAAADCPAGALFPVVIDSKDCAVPQTLSHGGGSYSCNFKATVSGNAQTLTDTVTFFGHDGSSHSVQASHSATVTISDVLPSASVIKSLVGIVCAEVSYMSR